jgi:streptogramin lyase
VRVAVAAVASALAVAAGPAQVATGEWTYGLAYARGSVWAGGLTQGDVLRIDPRTGRVVERLPVGARIFNLAVAPDGVWAVDNVLSRAVRIDPGSSRVTKRVRVGLAPYDVASGFGSVWVSNAGDGTVSRITGGRVVKTIRVGVEPNGLAAYGRFMWVTDHTAGKLLRLDPRTNRIAGSVALPGADWVTRVGASLYVSQETNVVTRVEMRTLRVTGRVRVGRNPLGSAAVGHALWVPCIDGGVIDVVDPVSLRIVRRLRPGSSPIVVLQAAGHVWVSRTTGRSIAKF